MLVINLFKKIKSILLVELEELIARNLSRCAQQRVGIRNAMTPERQQILQVNLQDQEQFTIKLINFYNRFVHPANQITLEGRDLSRLNRSLEEYSYGKNAGEKALFV